MAAKANLRVVTDRDATGMQTLLVGLDGACRRVLDPLLAADQLPALAGVLGDGVVADLESQIPPWTPSAWPSLYTGVNPGKHGVFDFLTFDGYDWTVVNHSHVREYALWELLDSHGLGSVVVNVPVTAPPRPFDGALLPGYVAPEDPDGHPDGIMAEVRDEIGDYRVYAPEGVEGDEQLEWYRRLTEMRGEAFRYLAADVDPDFGFLQFQQTDTVFHERPGDEAAVQMVYEAVDDQLAKTLDACDPDTVIVASDHGIGPYEGVEFRVNEYLRDRGLLETTRGEGGMPSWTAITRGREERDSSLATRIVEAASTLGVTSQRVASVLDRFGLREFVQDRVSTETVRAGTERVDFPESTVYMRSRTELGVRINKAGRDPEGRVSPSEYSSVRADVVSALRDARAPDGTAIFESVDPADEHFDGPYVDEAVDVVAVPANFDNAVTASLTGDPVGDLPGDGTAYWNHKRDGIVALAGSGVDTDADLDDPHLFDVAPTVLASLDVPPSSRMDGRQLPVIDAVPTASYDHFDASPVARDSEAVSRRLANLGYLDDNDN